MRAARVFYVSAAGLEAYAVGRDAVDRVAGFASDAAGVQAFAAHVRSLPRVPVRFAVDIAGEDFHVETIPRLRWRERRALLDRRWRQRFADAGPGLALSLGVHRAERHEERVLFGAFTQPQQLRPWLDVIAQASVPVAGVYSVAQLAPRLLERMDIATTSALLVASGRAGLRQTYVEAGRLRFSRLGPAAVPPASDARVVEDSQRDELDSLQRYLRSSGIADASAPVTVVRIGPADAVSNELAMKPDAHTASQVLAPESVARRLGLRRRPAGVDWEAFAIHLVATAAPSERYMDERLRAKTHRRHWRQLAIGAGSVLTAAFLLAAVGAFRETQRLRQQTADLRLRIQAGVAEHDRLAALQPMLPTSIESLNAIAGLQRELRRLGEPMDASLRRISGALDAVPAIEIDGLRWHRGERADAAGNTPGAGASIETVELDGRVVGGSQVDDRSAARTIDALIVELERQRGLALVETRVPFAATAQARVAGDLGVETAAGDRRFTLVVARRDGS